MAEYIERDALLEARELAICAYENAGVFNADAIRNHLKPLLDAVVDTPAAYVAPVVHGRWDDSGRYTFPNGATAVRCTICGCALNESEYHLYDWNYCPICGAKMDECNEPEN